MLITGAWGFVLPFPKKKFITVNTMFNGILHFKNEFTNILDCSLNQKIGKIEMLMSEKNRNKKWICSLSTSHIYLLQQLLYQIHTSYEEIFYGISKYHWLQKYRMYWTIYTRKLHLIMSILFACPNGK